MGDRAPRPRTGLRLALLAARGLDGSSAPEQRIVIVRARRVEALDLAAHRFEPSD